MIAGTDTANKPTRASKAAVAYELIREGIVAGRYPPGSRLIIDQLARDLNVSAVPIREAVRRLEVGGYVTFQQNLGATVATIDAQAYGESMQTLAVLEGAATALASPHLTADDLEEASAINDAMKASLEALDPVKFTAGNHAFHSVLYGHCPNTHLGSVIEREWDRLKVIRRSTFAFVPERAREAVIEHDELLRLLSVDAPANDIEAFARAHRMRTANRFLHRWSPVERDTTDLDRMTDHEI